MKNIRTEHTIKNRAYSIMKTYFRKKIKTPSTKSIEKIVLILEAKVD